MRKLLLLLLMPLLTGNLFAQHYKIELTFIGEKQASSFVKELVFKDTLTNTIVKTVNVPSINPFYNLDYPEHVKASKRVGYKVYDLSGKNLTDVVPSSVLKLYPYENPSMMKPTRGQYTVDLRITGDYAFLKFDYAVGNDTVRMVEYSVLHIYKSDGTEVFSRTDYDINVVRFDIEPSGRYVFYAYGLRSRSKILIPGGIKIIDLLNSKHTMELPGEGIAGQFLNSTSLYMFYNGAFHAGKPERWLKILDFKDMKMYSHCYLFNEIMNIESLDSTGVKYKNGERDQYLTKFQIDDLEWKQYNLKGNYIEYQYFADSSFADDVEAIIFRNTDNPGFSKTYYIKDLNPFKNLPYPVYDSTKNNSLFFSLGKTPPAQILPPGVFKRYAPLLNHDVRFESGHTSMTCNGNKDFAVLIFSFSAGLRYHNIVSYSKVYVYNNQADKIFSFEDTDGYIWDAKLDQKGEYLSYRFALGNIDTVLTSGYRIFNLKQPALSVPVYLDNAAGQFVAPGLFVIYSDTLMNGSVAGTTLRVYDLKKNKVYKKTYDNERLKALTSYTNNGLIFNGNKTELFVNEFEEEDLSWKKLSKNGK